jgi:hypothetical protein
MFGAMDLEIALTASAPALNRLPRQDHRRKFLGVCEKELDYQWWSCEGGRRFLAQWGEQAEALGWTARDLFGLALTTLGQEQEPAPSAVTREATEDGRKRYLQEERY